MAIETALIQELLEQKFANKVVNFEMQKDIFSFEVTTESVRDVILFLKEEEDTNFHFLTDLCGVHYPDNTIDQQFCVVYHLHNWVENTIIRIKTYRKHTVYFVPRSIGFFQKILAVV